MVGEISSENYRIEFNPFLSNIIQENFEGMSLLVYYENMNIIKWH